VRQAHELRLLLGDALSNKPFEVLDGKKVGLRGHVSASGIVATCVGCCNRSWLRRFRTAQRQGDIAELDLRADKILRARYRFDEGLSVHLLPRHRPPRRWREIGTADALQRPI
jgi:hypothetical protein